MPADGPDADIWGEDDNARRYDAFARQHPIYQDTSRDLIALAGLSAGAAVVDLACGTGITSREILAALGPGGKVTGADKSAAMLAVAARAIADPRITWVQARAENVDRHVTGPIDAVVCNSAIWQTDLAATAAAVRNLLVTGGRFVFNVGAGYLGQQKDPNFGDDRPSPVSIMRDIAAQDHGWRPPDPRKRIAGPREGTTPTVPTPRHSTWTSRADLARRAGQRAILSARAARSQGRAPSPPSTSALIIIPLAARAET